VDFLARYPEGDQELIQVCAEAREPATAERELRALAEAGRAFPKARRLLLTLTHDGRPAAVPKGVTAQPAYVWLLTKPGA
jgi:hypothetical protein